MIETRKLGKSDLNVPNVCLGTMSFGSQTDEADAHSQLDFALENGVNFIDTAEMYPVPPDQTTFNQTEKIVGRWIKNKRRDSIVLATKIAGAGRGMEYLRGGKTLRVNREQIRAALEGSLKRLQTDYIDLYQIHWPDRNQPMFGLWRFDPSKERETTPILEQLKALGELVKEGKIRAVGVSNEHPWGIMEFVRAAKERDLPYIASTQNAYNLLNRKFEYGLDEVCWRENVALLAYSPLAFGHLTAKYLDNPSASGRITIFADRNYGERYDKPAVQSAVKAYADLARSNGITPTHLALFFLVRQPFVTSTILGASNLAQLKEDINACREPIDSALADELLRQIDRIHLFHSNPAP
ncbi:MAG: aldo/keto reductase [Helicobacteraceae bacterium]|jgi:aryl-alcohol dehydrogenase-like predicted oxidoreductase|nr:aldo/keto reductase [Helicobacteraceae bacterium]